MLHTFAMIQGEQGNGRTKLELFEGGGHGVPQRASGVC